jgi:hypothetical protein
MCAAAKNKYLTGFEARTDETTNQSTKRVKVTRKSLVMFERAARFPPPRLIFIFRGNPKGGKPGSPSFCLLLLGEARKSN